MRASAIGSNAVEDVDWTRYDPPEALSLIPNITSETIVSVVQSSLDNIRRQIEAERQHQKQEGLGKASQRDNGGHQNRTEAELSIGPSGGGSDKGKGATCDEDAGSSPVHRQLPEVPAHWPFPPEKNIPLQWPGRAAEKPQGRHGFLPRLIRHFVGVRDNADRDLPAMSLSVRDPLSDDGSDAARPSSFTQRIYEHIKRPSAEQVGEMVECVSCLEDIPLRGSVKTVCHRYCKECFCRLVQTAIDNSAQWPPKCCLNPIPYRTITKHTAGDLLRAYREKAEEFQVPAASRIYCGIPDCGEWIRPSQTDAATKTGTCPRGHLVCTLCRQAAHPQLGAASSSAAGAQSQFCPFDRDRQLADRLAAVEGWKRCPQCGVLVEHREACQHMTCRCGAQFCYVCARVWRTCGCTVEQLQAHKREAAARRAARRAADAAAEAEARAVQDALRRVAEYEARQAAAREAELAALRAAAEERRRRREQRRRDTVAARYTGLRRTLADLGDLQRTALATAQREEARGAEGRAAAERNALAARLARERDAARSEAQAALVGREREWEREFRARAAREEELEAEYEKKLRAFWDGVAGGPLEVRMALWAYMWKNDERMDEWTRWRDGELRTLRAAQGEMLAGRMREAEEARRQLECDVAAEEGEMRRKHAAERKWFELVREERTRLLGELETVEMENGEDTGSQGASSEDDEIIAFFHDDQPYLVPIRVH